jgi:hypothetical protein
MDTVIGEMFNHMILFLNIMNFIVWTIAYFRYEVNNKRGIMIKIILLVMSGMSFIVLFKPLIAP